MKINRIEISAFGKLKNFSLVLSDGMNVIFGENENGKTTVMTFIKCMFYGTGNKKHSLKESIREKYTPWDGSKMGGRIYFEHGGTNYCLEREFKGSDSADGITLTDKDTGKQLSADSRVGEKLFMLTEAAFVRTVFIDNNVSFAEDADAKSDLNTRLSSIFAGADGGVSHQKTEKRLLDAKNKVLSVTGKAGTLAKDRDKLDELRKKAQYMLNAEKEMSAVSDEIETTKARIASAEAEYEKEKEIVEAESEIKNAARLAQYAGLLEQIEENDKKLTAANGEVIKKSFTDTAKLGLAKYEKHRKNAIDLEKRAQELKNLFESASGMSKEDAEKQIADLAKQEEDIKNQIAQNDIIISAKQQDIANLKAQSTHASRTVKKINPYLFAAGLVFAAAMAIMYYAVPISHFSLGAAIVSVICLLLSFIIKPKNKTEEYENKILTLQDELKVLSDKRSELSFALENCIKNKAAAQTAIENNADLAKRYKSEADEKEKQACDEQKSADNALADLITYYSKWKTVNTAEEIAQENDRLNLLFEKRRELQLQANVYSGDFGSITYAQAKSRLEGLSSRQSLISDEEFAAHKASYEKLRDDISNNKTRKARLEEQLVSGFKDFVNPQTVAREIKELEEKVKAKEEFCAAALLAAEVLKQSADGMRKSYGAALENKAVKIFEKLTAGKYGMLSVDDNLKISTEEKGLFGTKSTDYLSRGTEDQAYLSLRLAVSSLLSGEESLPVMLDDSLSQFDDDRLKAAIGFLCDYSKDNQTVLFTCHGAIRDLASKAGCEILKPFG